MVGAELQKLSEEFAPAAPQLARGRGWEPRIDLVETAEALVVTAELAGVRAEDISIAYRAESHQLCVRGVRRAPQHSDQDSALPHHLEIYFGTFERDVELPEIELDSKAMRASYRNGFLVVVIPKAGADLLMRGTRRTITVRSV